MKATGIVRRIDDLGRVVIPKEIRRSIGMQEGDPLEIYVEDKNVIFCPYNHDYKRDLETIKEKVLDNFNYTPEELGVLVFAFDTIAQMIKGE